MARILFLSSSKFKDITPISENVRVGDKIDTVIWEAQHRYIKPILCASLYDEITTQINDNTLSDANRTLLQDYIQPALAFYTYYLLLPYSWVKVREAGPTNSQGDNYVVVGRNDVEYLRDTALSSAQEWALRAQEYIDDNKSDFPSYECDFDEANGVVNPHFMSVRKSDAFRYRKLKNWRR